MSSRLAGYLKGSVPGLLDTTQSSRLLHDTEATLLFATFDSQTATGGAPYARDEAPPGLRNRIVVETTRGVSRWRFVPPPRLVPGAKLQDNWPKYLTICGQSVICTEEQWDIYNLDPAYECLVLPPPLNPVIFRKVPRDPSDQLAEAPGLSTLPSYSTQPTYGHGSSQYAAQQKQITSHRASLNLNTAQDSGVAVPLQRIRPNDPSSSTLDPSGSSVHDHSVRSREFITTAHPSASSASVPQQQSRPNARVRIGAPTSIRSVKLPRAPSNQDMSNSGIDAVIPSSEASVTNMGPALAQPIVTAGATLRETIATPAANAAKLAETTNRSTTHRDVSVELKEIIKETNTPEISADTIPKPADAGGSVGPVPAATKAPTNSSANGIPHLSMEARRAPTSGAVPAPASTNVLGPMSGAADASVPANVPEFTEASLGPANAPAVSVPASANILELTDVNPVPTAVPASSAPILEPPAPATASEPVDAVPTELEDPAPATVSEPVGTSASGVAPEPTTAPTSSVPATASEAADSPANGPVPTADLADASLLPTTVSTSLTPATTSEPVDAVPTELEDPAPATVSEPVGTSASGVAHELMPAPTEASPVPTTTPTSSAPATASEPVDVPATASEPTPDLREARPMTAPTSSAPALEDPAPATAFETIDASTEASVCEPGTPDTSTAVPTDATIPELVETSSCDASPKASNCEPTDESTPTPPLLGPAETIALEDSTNTSLSKPEKVDVPGSPTHAVDSQTTGASIAMPPDARIPKPVHKPMKTTVGSTPTSMTARTNATVPELRELTENVPPEPTEKNLFEPAPEPADARIPRPSADVPESSRNVSVPEPTDANVSEPTAPADLNVDLTHIPEPSLEPSQDAEPSNTGVLKSTNGTEANASKARAEPIRPRKPSAASRTDVRPSTSAELRHLPVSKPSELPNAPIKRTQSSTATRVPAKTKPKLSVPGAPSRSGESKPTASYDHAQRSSRIPRPEASGPVGPSSSRPSSQFGLTSRIPRLCRTASSGSPSLTPVASPAAGPTGSVSAPPASSAHKVSARASVERPSKASVRSADQFAPTPIATSDVCNHTGSRLGGVHGGNTSTESQPVSSEIPCEQPNDVGETSASSRGAPTPLRAISPDSRPVPSTLYTTARSSSGRPCASQQSPSIHTSTQLYPELYSDVKMPGAYPKQTAHPEPDVSTPWDHQASIYPQVPNFAPRYASAPTPGETSDAVSCDPNVSFGRPVDNSFSFESPYNVIIGAQPFPSSHNPFPSSHSFNFATFTFNTTSIGERDYDMVGGDHTEPTIVDCVMSDIEDTYPCIHLGKHMADEPDYADPNQLDPNPHKRAKPCHTEATASKWEAQRRQRLYRRREASRRQRLSRLPQRTRSHDADVFVYLPPETYAASYAWSHTPTPGQPATSEQEHQESLQESIHKLANLEKDKPLWEEAARVREKAEAAEGYQRKTPTTDGAVHTAAQAGPDVNMYQEEEDVAALQDYLFKSRKRQKEKWAHVAHWTDTHAVERYQALCTTFDKAKFTEDNPPDFYEIPWPIIFSPNSTQPADIDWDSTELFFLMAEQHMTSAAYVDFIMKSHKRFHPDRWRARNLLKSLAGHPLLQKLVEDTGNTVSQAVTPIWHRLRGRADD